MNAKALTTGAVIRYPFLWANQAARGETEGRKDRPVAVAVRMVRPDHPDTLILFPITSKQPASDSFSAEIPRQEKLRAGLDPDLRLWIVLDDVNVDYVGRSVYLKDQEPSGRLGRKFFLPLVLEFIRRKDEINAVDRTR